MKELPELYSYLCEDWFAAAYDDVLFYGEGFIKLNLRNGNCLIRHVPYKKIYEQTLRPRTKKVRKSRITKPRVKARKQKTKKTSKRT